MQSLMFYFCLVVFTGAFAQSPDNSLDLMLTREAIPLVRLLCDPLHFDGKEVVVAGFVDRTVLSGSIYSNKEDWRHGLILNSIQLAFSANHLTTPGYRGPLVIKGLYSMKKANKLDVNGVITVSSVALPTQSYVNYLAQLSEQISKKVKVLSNPNVTLSDVEKSDLTALLISLESELSKIKRNDALMDKSNDSQQSADPFSNPGNGQRSKEQKRATVGKGQE